MFNFFKKPEAAPVTTETKSVSIAGVEFAVTFTKPEVVKAKAMAKVEARKEAAKKYYNDIIENLKVA